MMLKGRRSKTSESTFKAGLSNNIVVVKINTGLGPVGHR